MAPRSRKRPSDDFVVPDNEDEVAPRAKRVKSEEGGKSTKVDKSASAKLASDSKKINASDDAIVIGGGKISKEGEEYWELSTTRRVAISTYGGKRMVNIREYYEKDGEQLPGKKGISMPLAQFERLVTLLPHIETVLKGKGETLPRPDYGGAEEGGGAEDTEKEREAEEENDEAEEEAEEEEEEEGKKPAKSKRKNFEETSEEE